MVSVTHDWLEKLYGNSPGYFTIVVFKDGRPAVVKAYNSSTLNEAALAIEGTRSGDVYISCATFKDAPTLKNRGSYSDTVSISGFWADIDIDGPGHKPDPNKKPLPKTVEEALSIFDNMPKPSYIIHSGGGLQAWWLFKEPWVYNDPQLAQSIVKDWQRYLTKNADDKGYHVDNVGDLARILRPPGSVNRKLDSAREVYLYQDSDTQYAQQELISLGIPPAPRTASEIIDESGLDDWPQILEPHGWTRIRERDSDGATEWYRPGKTEGTISAVTNPYGVPVMVNFSSTADLPVGPGQRLTKFKVWAHLNYNGDLVEAKNALDARKTVDNDALVLRAEKYKINRINWDEFWTEVPDYIEWLAEPIIEKGRQVALFSGAKQGKSLLLLDICAALATGQSVIGGEAKDPINILYIDRENMKEDLRDRLTDMGYGPDSVLENLHYYWFPNIPWLDTREGGLDLLGLALYHNAQLVVIDTLSRVVAGGENDNDTYHDFYKHTGIFLKSRGITLVRLDHSGKDANKGMRGASSKTTDVDAVWELRLEDDDKTVRLTRTHSRTIHGANRVVLSRQADPKLHHLPIDVIQATSSDPIENCAVQMDMAGIPESLGLNAAWDQFKDWPGRESAGWTSTIVKDAQKRRQLKDKK